MHAPKSWYRFFFLTQVKIDSRSFGEYPWVFSYHFLCSQCLCNRVGSQLINALSWDENKQQQIITSVLCSEVMTVKTMPNKDSVTLWKCYAKIWSRKCGIQICMSSGFLVKSKCVCFWARAKWEFRAWKHVFTNCL